MTPRLKIDYEKNITSKLMSKLSLKNKNAGGKNMHQPDNEANTLVSLIIETVLNYYFLPQKFILALKNRQK